MLIGLLHLHRTLGYVVFVIALLNVVLVLSRARTDPKAARLVAGLTRYGVRMAGGLNVVLGLAVWALSDHWPVSTPWLWISLLLWIPVELLGKRFVLPEAAMVQDGGQGRGGMILGAVGQLVCLAIIFGLMSARP